MNRVVLIGRLTKDPELKYTPGTGAAVSTFTIAVDRRMSKNGQREADFIRIVAWNKTAELVANYMSKGRRIGISGRIQTSTYEGRDGEKKYTTEVVADEIEFLDKAPGSTGAPNRQSSDSGSDLNGQNDINSGNYGDDMIPIDDGEIPF